MEKLHVRDGDGRWQLGAFAFAELWSHIDGYRWLAKILRSIGLLPLLDGAYVRFAKWRLNRHCSDGSCSTSALNDKSSTG